MMTALLLGVTRPVWLPAWANSDLLTSVVLMAFGASQLVALLLLGSSTFIGNQRTAMIALCGLLVLAGGYLLLAGLHVVAMPTIPTPGPYTYGVAIAALVGLVILQFIPRRR